MRPHMRPTHAEIDVFQVHTMGKQFTVSVHGYIMAEPTDLEIQNWLNHALAVFTN